MLLGLPLGVQPGLLLRLLLGLLLGLPLGLLLGIPLGLLLGMLLALLLGLRLDWLLGLPLGWWWRPLLVRLLGLLLDLQLGLPKGVRIWPGVPPQFCPRGDPALESSMQPLVEVQPYSPPAEELNPGAGAVPPGLQNDTVAGFPTGIRGGFLPKPN